MPHRVACAAIVSLAALLRVHAAADGYLHEWDERYHALVAKHLMAHPLKPTLYESPVLPYDPRSSFENHVWLHKPPLALWLMASSMRVFGVHEAAVRLPSLLLSTASVWLTYSIGRVLFDPVRALLAAFLHAVTSLLISLAAGRSATDHVDTAFLFLFELGVFLSVRGWREPPAAPGRTGVPWRRSIAVGLVMGLALLTKSVVALLLVPLFLVWSWVRQDGLSRLAAGGALVVVTGLALWAPWQIYVLYAFPVEAQWELAYSLAHVLEPLEGHAGGPFFHLWRMPRIFGELVYLPLVWFLWKITRRGGRIEIALALWLLIPYALFSLVATKMPAYVLVGAPAVFLIVAEACSRLWANRSGPCARASIAMLVPLLVLPVRLCLDGSKLLRRHDRHPPWAQELRSLRDRWPGERVVIFGSARPIETMFYTPHTAYASLPQSSLVRELQRRGFRVAVHDRGQLPRELRDSAAITRLRP